MVDFGEYKTIYQYGSIFTVRDNNGNCKSITSKNKEVMNQYYSIATPDSQGYIHLFYNEDYKKTVTVVDYEGYILDNIEMVGGVTNRYGTLTANVQLSKDYKYAILRYGDNYYLYNLKEHKKIMKFNSTCTISDISEDGSKLILSLDEIWMILEKDQKVLEIPKGEYTGIRLIDGGFIANILSIYDFLDDKGNIIAKNIISYLDIKNYVIKENNIYKFYSNSSLVKELDALQFVSGQLNNNYIAKNYGTYDYVYYNNKGEEINSQAYKTEVKFSKKGYTYVSLDLKEYFIIDKDNNKVSDKYSNIKDLENYNHEGYFYTASKDSVNYLLSYNGKVLEEGFNTIQKIYNKVFVIYSNYTVVYDYNTQEKLCNINGKNLEFEEYYAYREELGEKQYFSYKTGKKIYSH